MISHFPMGIHALLVNNFRLYQLHAHANKDMSFLQNIIFQTAIKAIYPQDFKIIIRLKFFSFLCLVSLTRITS